MASTDSLKVIAIAGRTDSTGAAAADQDQEETRLLASATLAPGFLPNMLNQSSNPNAFRVRQDTGANMAVKIGSGTTKVDGYVIQGTVAGQGSYVVRLDAATKTVTVPAADATNPARYGVYLFVNDTAYGGTAARAFVDVNCIRGTPAGSPVTPGPLAAWSAYVLLWEFQLPANATAVTNTILDAGTDDRVEAAAALGSQGPRRFATMAKLTATVGSPVEGQMATVTGEDRIYVYDGAAWQRAAWYSFLGRTGCMLRRAANQSVPNTTTQAISWDTEDLDTDGFIAVTGTTVTIPGTLGGVYAITAFVTGPSSWHQSVSARLLLTVGGTNFYNLLSGNAGVPSDSNVGGTVVLSLAGATAFTVSVQHALGSSQNFTAQLACHRVGI